MSEDVSIRRMTADDLVEVVALERRCHLHPWSAELFRRELENPLALIELACLDNRLVGYLCAWQVADELHILNLATAPETRRRGVAGRLLARCLDRTAEKRDMQVLLEVRSGNAAAIALYRAHGFTVSGRRRRYYPDGEDALLMTREAGTGTAPLKGNESR